MPDLDVKLVTSLWVGEWLKLSIQSDWLSLAIRVSWSWWWIWATCFVWPRTNFRIARWNGSGHEKWNKFGWKRGNIDQDRSAQRRTIVERKCKHGLVEIIKMNIWSSFNKNDDVLQLEYWRRQVFLSFLLWDALRQYALCHFTIHGR